MLIYTYDLSKSKGKIAMTLTEFFARLMPSDPIKERSLSDFGLYPVQTQEIEKRIGICRPLEWLALRTGIPPAVFNLILQEGAKIVQITPKKGETPARHEARLENGDTQLFEIKDENGKTVSMHATIAPDYENTDFLNLILIKNGHTLSLLFCINPQKEGEIFIASINTKYRGKIDRQIWVFITPNALEKMFAGFGILPEDARPDALPGRDGPMPAIAWGVKNSMGVAPPAL